jgi:hypothetical protein
LWSRQRIQLVFQIGLRVRQLGRLAIEGARLEGLALQRGVKHQQACHANTENADQDQQKWEASQARGRIRNYM